MSEYIYALIGPAGPGAVALIVPFVIAGCLVLAVVACAFAVVPRFGVFLVPKVAEPRFADHVPFRYLDDDGMTMHASGGFMVRVWALEGMDHTTLGSQERRALYFARLTALNGLALLRGASSARMVLLTLRERVSDEERGVYGSGLARSGARDFLSEITRRWDDHTRTGIYRNRHFLAVYARGARAGELFNDVDGVLRSTLGRYRPRLLRASVNGDSPLTPFAAFVSAASRPNPRVAPGAALNELVSCDEGAFMRSGRVQFRNGDATRYVDVLGVRGLPDRVGESLALSLQRIQGELVIAQSIVPLDPAGAVYSLTRGQSSEKSVATGGVDPSTPWTEVSSVLQGLHEELPQAEAVEYQLSVFPSGDSEEALTSCVDQCQRAFSAAQMPVVREGFAAESSWWGVLPHFEQTTRPWRLLTLDVASLALCQGASEGLGAHDWAGHPVTCFRSVEGSVYRFTFHPTEDDQEVGHAVVVGPTGGGKTTLMCHLAGQVLERIPRARVWLFDRYHGAECFCRAMGGDYVRLQGVSTTDDAAQGIQRVALNPLLQDDVPENRAFVREWLLALVSGEGNPEVEADVGRAIQMLYEYAPREHRRLAHLYQSAFGPESEGRRQLARWVFDEVLAPVFDAGEDSVGDLQSSLVAFDCTAAIDNARLAGPIVSYLMHRIRMESLQRGEPTLIFVDETEPLLADQEFFRFFRQGLQEGRKLRQVLVSCFQRPSAIQRLGIGDLIRGQCPTAFLFPNPAAAPEDYEWFDLTSGELDFVLGRSHVEYRHSVLVKRYLGAHTAILDTSLLALGDLLPLYSSGRGDVIAMRRLVAERGREAGLDAYLRRR